MEQLKVEIQAIADRKSLMWASTPGSIDPLKLTNEIKDANDILTHINSDELYDAKVSAIRSIANQTSSGLIYDAVNSLLDTRRGYIRKNPPVKSFYFISFMYGASNKTFENRVLDVHPLVWQKHVNEEYPGQYVLLNWVEISGTVYENYLAEEPVLDKKVVKYVIGDLSDAEGVLFMLQKDAAKYGHVSLVDYYDAIGRTSVYTDNKYGWTHENMLKAQLIKVRQGFIIKFPPVEEI